jgi:uncharacterized short protein YbdD (DUF466 family)
MTRSVQDRAMDRLRLREDGIRLQPRFKAYGPSGYLICGACGQDFGESRIDSYIEHVKKKHPQYVAKRYVYVDANGHRHRRSKESSGHMRCVDCGGQLVEVHADGSEPVGFVVDPQYGLREE